MKLLCFGEVVWDEIRGERFIGGGAFNVAAHARILGVDEVFLLSAVGDDDLGLATRETIRRYKVRDDFVAAADVDTCLVKAAIDADGNPAFSIPDPTSFDRITFDDADLRRIRDLDFDCCYFGTIAQRHAATRDSLWRLIQEVNFRHVFCDVNLRMDFHDREVIEWSLRHVDTLKLNETEASIVGRLLGIDEPDRRRFCARLRAEFGIRWICLTGGEDGAWISFPDGFDYVPAVPVQVADAVGPGDAFSAAIINRLYSGHTPRDACEFACRVGALVASRRGAVPHYSLSEV
ncbi:MAG: hypothetical protein JW959_04010 [Pirellulales bacterium]|nr:hypothetical protein [Pirellulales bacterium]